MKFKRTINAFKIVSGKIEYNQKIKDAVLDPRITIQSLHINGGYDWIDSKYQFIKLLISRGQILSIETHSDLLGREDYLAAVRNGIPYSYSFALKFTPGTGKGSFASEKRLHAAREKWTNFVSTFNQVGA